jgi:hypothetical protein
MSVNARLYRVPEAHLAELGTPLLLEIDEADTLLIDKMELEVLGRLTPLQLGGHVPASLDLNVLDSEPFANTGFLLIRPEAVPALRSRIPPLIAWLVDEFDVRSLEIVYPASLRKWWNDPWGANAGEAVADALQDLDAFLDATPESGTVVLLSIG